MPPKREATQPGPATSPTSRARADGPTGAREAALVALQRSAGNAALSALLRQGSAVPRPGPSGPSVQRDAVAAAEKLLQYDPLSLDLFITGEEATQALAHLKTLKGSALKAGLARLGKVHLDRLVDNLPPGQQWGSTFALVLINLGDARVASHVAAMPQGTHLSATQKSLLGTLFRSGLKLELLLQIIETRFYLPFTAHPTKAGGAPWEAKGLRKAYEVLEKLPASHVEENNKLMNMLRYTNDVVAGSYNLSTADAAIGYKATDLGDLNDSKQGKKKDPLHGVNRFDKVVRHEVGHAVDAKMGWSAGAEPAKAARGGWKQYKNSIDTVAQDMIDDAQAGIKALSASQQADVVTDMKFVFANSAPGTLLSRIQARPWHAGLEDSEKTAIADDPLLDAVNICLTSSAPWYKHPSGGVALNGHIYMQSSTGPDRWHRYNVEARTRKVSKYQFRAAGEWFAECYAAYYDPASKGKGKLLEQADANTKTYFDDVVDKL